jgi:DNA repair protein RecO (recombination protein O)
MALFSTPAILIRRSEYGETDVIATFFSLAMGKVSLIAKAAKKSTRRFGGVLELFSEIDIVGNSGRRQGLAVLQEAVLKQPFAEIRTVPSRTAYASYWSELVNNWMEDLVAQAEVFFLLRHVFGELDRGKVPTAALSVLFQMRFLALSGHSPNLHHCVVCGRELATLPQDVLRVEVRRGGLACPGCVSQSGDHPRLSKGTAKQLIWVAGGDLGRASRMRFTSPALQEGLDFLERFVPYHLGRQPRSLKILRQLRGDG